MYFGTASLGRSDILDGESIRTNYFLFGPVLVPLDSAYWGRRTSFPVRRPARSVVLAYVQWSVLPIVLVVTGIVTHSQVAAAAVVLAWVVLWLLGGRTFGDEARKRRTLATFVGHAAPPEILHRGELEIALRDLEHVWHVHGKTLLDWRSLYPAEVPERALPLYYALCRYEASLGGENVMKNRARLAWDRIGRLR
jgi:hypothetical protein